MLHRPTASVRRGHPELVGQNVSIVPRPFHFSCNVQLTKRFERPVINTFAKLPAELKQEPHHAISRQLFGSEPISQSRDRFTDKCGLQAEVAHDNRNNPSVFAGFKKCQADFKACWKTLCQLFGRLPKKDVRFGLALSPKEVASAFADVNWAHRFPPVLSVDQAAELLSVPKGTVYLWSSRGLLRGCGRRVGKHLRFFRDRLLHKVFNEGLSNE